MISLATTSTNPVVHVYRNQATTSSLDVAEYFGKQHKNVLKAIQNIHDEEFTRLNFKLSKYKDSTGRKLPVYEMTKDGFSLLAMGFTGKKAEEFKIRYIKAFNRMLEELTPDRQEAIQNKRAAHRPMMDAVKETKQREGKKAKPGYFIHENLLCNKAVFGVRKAIDESTLTTPTAKLLERVRNYNEIMIRDGLTPNAREIKLTAYADIQRRYLMPIKAVKSRQTGLGK